MDVAPGGEPFRLTDPRQARIFRRLTLVGPGVASFYSEEVPDLSAMSVADMLAYLTSWQPSQDRERRIPRGLVSAVQHAVAVMPQRFAAEAEQFHGLDPVFVYALLHTLHESAAQAAEFTWAPVLKLCQWVMNRAETPQTEYDEANGRDRDRSWRLQVVARLLTGGFQQGVREIPYEFRSLAWDVLEPLTDDNDPTPAGDHLHVIAAFTKELLQHQPKRACCCTRQTCANNAKTHRNVSLRGSKYTSIRLVLRHMRATIAAVLQRSSRMRAGHTAQRGMKGVRYGQSSTNR
jgi:hypothetical protein